MTNLQIQIKRPERHTCCEMAKNTLYTTRLNGAWTWRMRLGGLRGLSVPVGFCPWCGEALK